MKLRLAEIEKEINDSKRPNSVFLSCPSCLQETIIIHEKYDELFVSFVEQNSVMRIWQDTHQMVMGACPECDNGALALLKYNKEKEEYICTKCGFASIWNFNFECSSCGNTYWDENGDENYLCEACHESIYE